MGTATNAKEPTLLEQELAKLAHRSLWQKGVDLLFGYDFFISYSWEDGRHYAVPLAADLKRRGFDCFLDSESYAKGDDWKTVGAMALRRTSRLILVGSPGALKSEPVLREVRIFSSDRRKIVPIDFGGTLSLQCIAQSPLRDYLTADILRIREESENLSEGPSSATLDDIQRAFDAARQSIKRGRALKAVASLLSILLAASLILWREEVASRREAQREAHVATANELVLQSEKFLPRYPQLSMMLAYYAAREALSAGASLPDNVVQLLQRTIRANPKRLKGPGAQAVAWSPDGSKLIGGGEDNIAHIWTFADLSEVGSLRGHTGWLEDVAWSPDGSLLATASRDGTARLWDAHTYAPVETISVAGTKSSEPLSIHPDVQTVSFHPREPIVAIAHTAGDSTPMGVIVWNYAHHEEQFHVTGFRAAFSPDGTKLATGDDTNRWGIVHLFNIQGATLFAMAGHERYVHNLAWSPDSTRLATASVDDTVRVWDANYGTLIRVLPNKFAMGLSWSPDGRFLASGGGQRVVRLWNARTLDEFNSLTTVLTLTGEPTSTGAQDYIESVAWSPDGTWLAVADRGAWGGNGNDDDKTSVRIYPVKAFTVKTANDLLDVVKQLVAVPSLDVVRKKVDQETAASPDSAP